MNIADTLGIIKMDFTDDVYGKEGENSRDVYKEHGIHLNANMIIEKTATSEVFDISNIGYLKKDYDYVSNEDKELTIVHSSILKNEEFSLPFPSVLIKTGIRYSPFSESTEMENYVFITELNPFEYIGRIMCTLEDEDKDIERADSNLFYIKGETLYVYGILHEGKGELENAIEIILKAIYIVSNLPKHQTYSYTPKDSKPEYYRRKGESTIKIVNRPIYYILNKKDDSNKIRVDRNKGYLKCEYSFLVRGHWRTLHNPKSFGVNRNNERIVQGYTWIKEYMKGEGELIKRVRLVK